MRSFTQNTYAVLITKHQSPNHVSIFYYLYWLSFYRSVKFDYRKICVTCCIRGRHEKSIQNNGIRRHGFVPYLSLNVLAKFHGKPSNLHTLLIHLKRRDSLEKRVRVFAFYRFINISCLHGGMCQHEKLPANETTELLSFTVCKLELHGKAIVSQSRSRRDYGLYLDEILRFSSFLVLALFCFLSKDFSPFWSVS